MQVNDLIIERSLDIKKVSSARVDRDVTLSTRPAIIYGLLITPINSYSGVVKIYDSAGGIGRLRATIVTDVTVSMVVKFPIPLFLAQGLYIKLNENISEVMVQYLIC